MRRGSFFPALGAALVLVPCAAAAEPKRTPWSTDGVAALASQLVEQAQGLEKGVRAASDAAEAAAAADPDREVGVGVRTVVLQDLAILESRAKSYRGAVKSGQEREQTRSLFGRIQSLTSLTAGDMRSMPDFASYRAGLEALEETVKELALFYAEEVEVTTPPDPLGQRY